MGSEVLFINRTGDQTYFNMKSFLIQPLLLIPTVLSSYEEQLGERYPWEDSMTKRKFMNEPSWDKYHPKDDKHAQDRWYQTSHIEHWNDHSHDHNHTHDHLQEHDHSHDQTHLHVEEHDHTHE